MLFRSGLCLYCGGSDHVRRDCGLRPHRTQAPMPIPTKGLVSKSFFLPVSVCCQQTSICVSALIDSGAEGNFLHQGVVTHLNIPVDPLPHQLTVFALDGLPVGQSLITHKTKPIQSQTSFLHRGNFMPSPPILRLLAHSRSTLVRRGQSGHFMVAT